MYPKRIDSLETFEKVDEYGFTGPQKIALQNAWRILKTQSAIHSTNIFLSFFGTYPKYFSVFESLSKGKGNETLHAHPSWVVAKVGTLIEEGLWDSSKFNGALQGMVKRHKKRFLKKSDIACMVSIINEYFKKVLDKYMTLTLSEALDKLCSQMIENYD